MMMIKFSVGSINLCTIVVYLALHTSCYKLSVCAQVRLCAVFQKGRRPTFINQAIKIVFMFAFFRNCLSRFFNM